MKTKNKSLFRLTIYPKYFTFNRPFPVCFPLCFYPENNSGRSIFLCVSLCNEISFVWPTTTRYSKVFLPTRPRQGLPIAFDINGYQKNSRFVLYFLKTKCTWDSCFISVLYRFSRLDYSKELHYFTILNYKSVLQKRGIILGCYTDIYLSDNIQKLRLNKRLDFYFIRIELPINVNLNKQDSNPTKQYLFFRIITGGYKRPAVDEARTSLARPQKKLGSFGLTHPLHSDSGAKERVAYPFHPETGRIGKMYNCITQP